MNQSQAITPRLARYVKPYKMLKDPVARFLSRVEKTDGCWLWTGKLGTAGYGEYWLSRRPHGAHRVSWTLFNGPIPNGLWVLHTCDVRRCVNPQHLFLGTTQDNTRDKMAKGRHRGGKGGAPQGYCKRGHEFVGENVMKNGKARTCRACYLFRRKRPAPAHDGDEQKREHVREIYTK